MSQIAQFKFIDESIKSYFDRNGYFNYTNTAGNGQFFQYIIDEQLDDPELPIEEELGDHADPSDCAYTWFYNNSETNFPIPNNMKIPNAKIELFIFYILQYIYKQNHVPTDQHIAQYILPKVDGKVSNESKSSQVDASVNGFQTNTNSCSGSSVTKTNKHQQTKPLYESKEGSISDSESIEGDDTDNIARCMMSDVAVNIARISKKSFKPEYAARAHLNIYTGKELIKDLLYQTEEQFDNELNLYYYTDISAALQMNDQQLFVYEIIRDNEEDVCEFGVINYDLHCKDTQEVLYGIIIPNDNSKKQQNKWLWKLDKFITRKEIMYFYGVSVDELPHSSRSMARFERELNQTLVIEEAIINDTDWFKVPQIKSLKRNVEIPKVNITLTKELWIKECSTSLRNNNFPLIPVVVNKNGGHWIEWVKIIYVQSQNIYIGIAFKFNENTNKLTVESICLDKGDIYNKHRLVGLNNIKYSRQLERFKVSITQIIFSDNAENSVDKKMTGLKQQITSQQNSIVRLKDSISKINCQRKHHDNINRNVVNSMICIQDEIKQMMNEEEQMENGEDFLMIGQIVDDVIKKYDVNIFNSNPIGVRQSIYINKEQARMWMNHINQSFRNVEEMYYYFDAMTAVQMVQKEAREYVMKDGKQFMTVIVNYELNDLSGNWLYGIINQQADTKYRYKLVALMTGEEIMGNYGIHAHDLPGKSRKHKDYIDKLLLQRKICKHDLNQIKWANLKIYKAQLMNNNDPTNKSITITRNVMSEYTHISLERINNGHDKKNRNLIPILVVDKYNHSYNIEWVLIVSIIHRNCPIGVSFRYNNIRDSFEATSIYLDKGEIETKHKLVGLKNDYCKNVRYFTVKRLKFKSNKDTVIDDDDDIAIQDDPWQNINAEKSKYDQLIQNERKKIQQLQQQLIEIQNQHQFENQKQQQAMYMQQQFQNQQLLNLATMQQPQQTSYPCPLYTNNNNINMNQNTNQNMNQQWISNGYAF